MPSSTSAPIEDLGNARTLVVREIEQTRAERDAFEEFHCQVSELSAVERQHPGTPRVASGVRVVDSSAVDSKERVLEAYRETLGAVPHFESEYGESIEENLLAELGGGLARALLDDAEFCPLVKQAVITRTRSRAAQRTQLLAILERERESLVEHSGRLSRIHDELESIRNAPVESASRDRHGDVAERLSTLREECQRTTTERQRHLHRPQSPGELIPGNWDTVRYAYRSLEVNFPVLSAAAAVLDRIERERARLVGDVR